MILKNAFLALTHMTGQISGRWFAPSLNDNESHLMETLAYQKIREGQMLSTLSETDWEDLLMVDQSASRPILSWFKALCVKSPSLLPALVTGINHHFQEMTNDGGESVFISGTHYPELLRHIAKPPLMLSCLGNLDVLRMPGVAVIGARQASYFGLQQSFNIGRQLADLSIMVVSGGAIGCDIAVHQGLLTQRSASSKACIVFAGGLKRLYPRRHGSIFDEVLRAGGLFISERPWYVGCQKRDFPIRNRIVSGMSETVIVTQAAAESGSLITANEALEQGRDVFVLRHELGDIRAQGSEILLEEGAIGFSDVDELLAHLVELPYSRQFHCNFIENHNDACQGCQNIGNVEEEHPQINN